MDWTVEVEFCFLQPVETTILASCVYSVVRGVATLTGRCCYLWQTVSNCWTPKLVCNTHRVKVTCHKGSLAFLLFNKCTVCKMSLNKRPPTYSTPFMTSSSLLARSVMISQSDSWTWVNSWDPGWFFLASSALIIFHHSYSVFIFRSSLYSVELNQNTDTTTYHPHCLAFLTCLTCKKTKNVLLHTCENISSLFSLEFDNSFRKR